MSNNLVTTDIFVKNHKIGIMRVGNVDYISLTDLARYINSEEPSDLIKQWMSNKDSFDFYSLWEEFNNPNFNSVEYHLIKNNVVGRNRFLMNPTKWKKEFNSIGIVPSAGKYSKGTYAHPDIAFEFASWLSPEFKLYLITEFERLKKNEYYQNKIEWNVSRLLSKVNYLVHTETIKNYIIPKVSEDQIRITYADEDEPKYPIQNWIRNKDVILYLGLWEQIHNPNYKGVEFDTFKNKAGFNSFKLSPQKWIKETNAFGSVTPTFAGTTANIQVKNDVCN